MNPGIIFIKGGKNQNIIKKYLAIGALVVSVTPLTCDERYCSPIIAPDSPSQGEFSYDFQDFRTVQVSSTSGTMTAEINNYPNQI